MNHLTPVQTGERSEEHTSELQSQSNLVCRLLLEKKNIHKSMIIAQEDATLLFQGYHGHRDLHSFPTRRSSDLCRRCGWNRPQPPTPNSQSRLIGRLGVGSWNLGVEV